MRTFVTRILQLCLIRCSSCCFIRASITGRSECHLTDRPANMSSLWKQTWEDRISGTEPIPFNQIVVGSRARCIAGGCGEAPSCCIFLNQFDVFARLISRCSRVTCCTHFGRPFPSGMFLYRAGLNPNDDKMTRSAKSQDLKAKKRNPDMAKDIRLDRVFVRIFVHLCYEADSRYWAASTTAISSSTSSSRGLSAPRDFVPRPCLVDRIGSCNATSDESNGNRRVERTAKIQTWWSAAFLQLFLFIATKSSAGGHLPLILFSYCSTVR